MALVAALVAALVVLAGCDSGSNADSHMARAQGYIETGDFRAAVIELKSALQQDRDNAEARWQLGLVYLKVGQGPSAMKELERARELGRRGEEVGLAIAEARILSREYDRALASLATMQVKGSPARVLVLSGDALLGLRDYDGAERAYNSALEASPDDIKAQRGMARVALARRDFNAAEKQLAVALQSGNDELEAWGLMGQLELMRGNFDAALKAYRHAEDLSSLTPGVRFGLLRAYLGLGDAAAADEHLRALHDASPKHPMVNYFRAVSARIRGKTEEAEAALLEVFQVQPDHLQGMLLMGSLKLAGGEYRQAEDYVTRFLDAVPDHVPARKLLASIYLELGQPADAVAALEPARDAASDDAGFLAMLGSALLRNQAYQEGTELLERAAELDPDAVGIRTQLAFSHLVTGSDEKAVESLQGVLGVEPGFRRANLLLIFAHLRNANWDAAIRAASDLADRQPDDPVPLNLLGSAYAGKGEIDSARAQFRKALELKADFHSATLNLARLDEQADDFVKAAERYEAILKVEPGQEQAAVRLAAIVERRGDQDETDRLLQMARTSNRLALAPRLLLANRYLARGRVEEATRVAEEAEEIAPRNPAVRRVAARVDAARGNFQRARVTYEELVREAPDNAQLAFELGVVQLRNREFVPAAESFERVLTLQPDHLGAQVTLGEMAIRDGRYEEALALSARLKERNADRAAGSMLEGDTHAVSGNFDLAVAAYRRALSVEPGNRVVMKLFAAYRQAGNLPAGKQVLEQWLTTHPDDGPIRLALATIDHTSGAQASAEASYEKLIEASPKNFVALNNLAWIYFERGDERALEFAERAFALAGQRPDVADTYGWLLLHAGQVEQSVSVLERAARGAPDAMEIRYHLAAALEKAGERERAKRLLEAVIGSGQRFEALADARKLLQTMQ